MDDLNQIKKELEATNDREITSLKNERNSSVKELEAKLTIQSEKIQDLDRNLA